VAIAAVRASGQVSDLNELLDSGWRECLVAGWLAGWLIAVGQRAELRPRMTSGIVRPMPRARCRSGFAGGVHLTTQGSSSLLGQQLSPRGCFDLG
jgi:hypothetical protein